MKKMSKYFKLVFFSIAVVLLTATLLSCFKKSYKITFLNYNHEILEVVPTIKGEIPVYSGKTPAKPSDKQYTYVFDGWDPALKEATEDATYRAVFKEITNKYTVSFDVEGVNPQEVAYGARAFKPIDPTKSGYEFVGWYNDDTLYDFNLPISGNLSLKAKWNIIEYTITYDLSDGTLPSGKNNPITYTVETDTFTLNNPEKSGYAFTGWTSSTITTPSTEVIISKGSVGNLSFTANYEKNVFTVTFDVDGIDSQELSYGAKATKPTDPTKTGYTFGGWYNGEELFDFNAPITSNLELKAKWDIINYDITYNLDDGALPDGKTNPATYNVETDTFTLNNPEKTGYTFTGWTSEKITTPTLAITVNKGSIGALEFTAHYEINNYTVTFDIEGIEAQELPYGAKVVKPADPTKTGYEFVGWYNGEELYDFNSPVTNNADLKAKWNIINYDITYNLDGGALPEGKTNPASYNVETDTFTLNNPTKTGYTFTGWTTSTITTPSKEVTVTKGSTGNLAFTANYAINKYTITFDVDGIASQEIEYNAKAVKPTDPSKTGYEFGGWYNGNALFDFNTPITSDIDFKAKWNIINYDITYNLDGGALPLGKTNPATYNVETDTFTLNNPEKTGYTFTGWTSSGITTPTLTITVDKGSTGALTFTANYTIITYDITYVLHDGTVDVANPTTYTVETPTITLNNPTKLGYNFIGWTGNGITSPTLEMNVVLGTIGDITFEAHFEIIEYDITYNLNGGALEEGKTNPAKYTIETETFTLNNPKKTGYIFSGWEGTGLDSASLEVTIALGSYGNRSYNAIFTPITYKVNFNKNNDNATGTMAKQDFTYDEAQTLSSNLFIYSGEVSHTLAGWALTKTGEIKYTNGQNVINLANDNGVTVELYAIWKIDIRQNSIRNSVSVTENSIAVDDNTYLYDGKEKRPVVSITGLTIEHDYTIEYSNNINAGTASITITGINEYYGVIEKTFKINQIGVTLLWQENDFTYNGSVQNVEIYFIGLNNQKINLTPVVTQESELNTQVESVFRNAGTYRLTVTLDENNSNYIILSSTDYTLDESNAYKEYIIKKATLHVDYGTKTFEYDGTQKSLDLTAFNIISESIYGNDDVSISGVNYEDNVRVDSGYYSFNCILDGEDKDNYEASDEIEITKKVVSITWSVDSWSDYIYSGVKTINASFEKIDNTTQYLTVSIKKDNNTASQVKDVGSYYLTVSPDYGNYRFIDADLSRSFDITQKHLSINWAGLTVEDNKNVIKKEYTSSAINLVKGTDVNIVGAAEGETIEYDFNMFTPATNVGEYLRELNLTNVSSNYEYTNEITSVYLKIIPKEISADLGNLSKEYTGSDLSWDVSLLGVYQSDTSNVSSSISYDTQPHNVDEYTATITLTGTKASNYVLDNTSVQPVSVTPKEVIVTANDQTISINDPISTVKPNFSYQVSGLVLGDTLSETPTYVVKDALENGNIKEDTDTSAVETTYYIFVSDLVASNNYTITYKPGKLNYVSNSFNNATIEFVESKFIYNGSEQKPAVSRVKVGSDTLTLTTDYIISYPSTGDNAYKIPGTYIVRITGQGDYAGSHKDFEFVIENADLSISISQKTGTSLTYNTSEQQATLDKPSVTATGENIAYLYSDTYDKDGDEYTSSVPGFTNAGTYTVYYIATANNYNQTSGNFTVTIDKADIVSYELGFGYDNNHVDSHNNPCYYINDNLVILSSNIHNPRAFGVNNEIIFGTFKLTSNIEGNSALLDKVGVNTRSITFIATESDLSTPNNNYNIDIFNYDIEVYAKVTYAGSDEETPRPWVCENAREEIVGAKYTPSATYIDFLAEDYATLLGYRIVFENSEITVGVDEEATIIGNATIYPILK